MLIYNSSQVLYLVPKDLTVRKFAFQARSIHAVKDFSESVNVVCQGGCRYHYVIHIAHHKIPILFCYVCQSLSHPSLKGCCRIAQAKRHPLPLVQALLTSKSGLFSVTFPQENLPEDRTQVQCREKLVIAKFREALVYAWYWVSVLYGQRVHVAKVAAES